VARLADSITTSHSLSHAHQRSAASTRSPATSKLSTIPYIQR